VFQLSHQTIPTIDRWGWLALLVAAPLLLFPSASATPIFLVVPALLWVQQRSASWRTALDWPILLMAVMILVSLYATYDIAVSLPKIAGVLLGIAAFYTCARLSVSRAGWWAGLAAFLGGGVAVAGLGLLGTRWGTKIDSLQPILDLLPARLVTLPGAEGGFQPNEVAGALLWVIPPLWALAWFTVSRAGVLRARFGPGWYASLVAVTLAANVLALGTFSLTQSRSGYLGLALAIPVMLVFGLPGRARWVALGASLLLAIGGLVYLAAGPVDILSGSDVQIDTLNGRLEIWSRALYGLQDFPFTGMGMNTFRQVVHILYPLFLISPDIDIAHAHNEFLQAGLDLGLPGLIAFIALYLGAFSMLARITQRRHLAVELKRIGNDPFDPTCLTLGLGGGLLAHLFYGLTDAIALGAKPGLLFWILLGLIVGLERFSWNSNNTH